MSEDEEKAAAKSRVADLVRNFKLNEVDYLRATYNETQARTDFITPLLKAFGWDVSNDKNQTSALREVIEEATVEVGEERLSKRPDYELRLARQRKLFVEAKKPSVHLDKDRAPAFQTRRYGYSASLPISIVTNFRQLAVYDCLPSPGENDDPAVARLKIFTCDEFEARFDDLWPLLSRAAVYSGAFDRQFDVGLTRKGSAQFDDRFLSQIRTWRQLLAVDMYRNSPNLTANELTYAVQLFLSRIVFLRICEDRDIEKYETLKALDAPGAFEGLMRVLRHADEFYDSGLFQLIDDEALGIRISDRTLRTVVAQLYYPYSPYNFAVVETKVLGEIYEQLLGEVITIVGNRVKIELRPEVRVSGGVVPTPTFVADTIVERTLGPAISGKSPADLDAFSVADICCGSGTFLLSAYEQLLDHYLAWYVDHDRAANVGQRIFEVLNGQWRLTFEERRRILLTHIRGVDIDPNAVEVTQFSLLLKLIENESANDLADFVRRHNERALPALGAVTRRGNSLVADDEWQTACGVMPDALRAKVIPFNWSDEFPEEMDRGGFDVIVGNPPYVRIQNMVAYLPEEADYYAQPESPYTVAQQDNFDKYALFLERSLSLVGDTGRVGVIVPNKFMTIQAGRAVRRLLTDGHVVENIVDFGVKQVFGPGTSNYTCILILDGGGAEFVRVEKPGPIEEWRYGHEGSISVISARDLGDDPWEFADEEVRALFARVRAQFTTSLEDVAEILVGVQTSADKVYIIRPVEEHADHVVIDWDERNWSIERGILRPCLYDAPLEAYRQPTSNAWIIFPYEIVRAPNRRSRARLLQPDEISARYPGAWSYLLGRRDELADRNVTGGPAGEQQWYQYGRSQSLTKFDTPKILLPALSLESRYCLDVLNTIITGGGNGPYYMLRARNGADVSTKYLLAVLNHPLSEALVRTNTSVFRGGYYSHGKQFIANLPVPILNEDHRTEIESLVTRLLEINASLDAARTPRDRTLIERDVHALRGEIESRLNDVFGLTEADLAIILSVPVPT
jgi:hypothetical protein